MWRSYSIGAKLKVLSARGMAVAGERIKHLEFITQAIGRMAQNSFVARGWCITVSSALLAFVIERSDPLLAVPAVLTVGVFSAIDVYYLRHEKRFRALYDEVRAMDDAEITFSMLPPPNCVSVRAVMVSPIILLLYGGILSVALVAAAGVAITNFPVEDLGVTQGDAKAEDICSWAAR